VIVVDNGGYQEIRDQEAARGIPPIGVELRTPDLAALAVAMGARGLRTTSTADLAELVSGALDADGPTLIHFDPLKGRTTMTANLDVAIVVAIYLIGMIAFGFWGKRRATTQSDFLVAVMVLIACALQDVVAALTVAYDILVGGLLVPILGGLVWRRGTNVGAVAAMAVGTVATLATMMYVGDIFANEPIYVGLASGLVVFVVGSLATKPTDPEVLAEWDRRSSGRETETVPAELT
jgi:hypothetical protein